MNIWQNNISNIPKNNTKIDVLIKTQHAHNNINIIRYTDVYFCEKQEDWYLPYFKSYLSQMTGHNIIIAWMYIPEYDTCYDSV